jgi:hypothetical protein
MTWSDAFISTLKDNDVRLVSYMPDNVLTPLIKGVTGDNYFRSINATRGDEAIGAVAGAYMGGMRSSPAFARHDDSITRSPRQCARAARVAARCRGLSPP